MRIILVVALLSLAGTAAEAQKGKRRCTGSPVDTLAVVDRVYRDCEVDVVAKQRGSTPRLAWSPNTTASAGQACFRARFEFVVDTAGLPESGTIRRVSSTDANFESAVRDQLSALRYFPAEKDGRRVRQLVIFESKAEIRRVVSSSPGGPPPSIRGPRC